MAESRSWRTFMVQETFGRETELDPNFRSHNLQCEGCEGHSFKKKKKSTYLTRQVCHNLQKMGLKYIKRTGRLKN